MNKFFTFCFLSFGIGLSTLLSQTIDKSLMHDGVNREFTVHLPTDFQVGGPALPVVLNFHGLGSSAFEQMLYSNYNAISDTGQFIVVYPQGLVATVGGQSNTHWNASFGTGVDDVGFINSLIDQLYIDYGIDLSRVYSTGMSNGGYMSYHLACQMPDRIAAIASVTGALTYPDMATCDPARPMPVMQFHGTLDDVVPYAGTPLLNPSIPDVVDFWVQHNQCVATPDTIEIPDLIPSDNVTATLYQYGACDSGSSVHFYRLQDGGHTWPGGIPLPQLGNTCLDFSASIKIWQFFLQYQHPDPRPVTISGIADLQLQQSWGRAFPNPFGQQLQLETEIALNRVQLTDVQGRTLWQGSALFAGQQLNIPTGHLPTGVYLLQLDTPQGRIVEKLLHTER